MIMYEWIPVCTAHSHQHKAIPATDRWYHTVYGVMYTCREHSIVLGARFKSSFYQWEPLPASELAQPTSERVQP